MTGRAGAAPLPPSSMNAFRRLNQVFQCGQLFAADTGSLPPRVMVAAPPADDADRAGEAVPSGPEVCMRGGGDITEGVGL